MRKFFIRKKSGKPFPNGDHFAVSEKIVTNPYDPNHRVAYELEDGNCVNVELCNLIREINYVTVGELKEKISNIPDDTQIMVYESHFEHCEPLEGMEYNEKEGKFILDYWSA